MPRRKRVLSTSSSSSSLSDEAYLLRLEQNMDDPSWSWAYSDDSENERVEAAYEERLREMGMDMMDEIDMHFEDVMREINEKKARKAEKRRNRVPKTTRKKRKYVRKPKAAKVTSPTPNPNVRPTPQHHSTPMNRSSNESSIMPATTPTPRHHSTPMSRFLDESSDMPASTAKPRHHSTPIGRTLNADESRIMPPELSTDASAMNAIDATSNILASSSTSGQREQMSQSIAIDNNDSDRPEDTLKVSLPNGKWRRAVCILRKTKTFSVTSRKTLLISTRRDQTIDTSEVVSPVADHKAQLLQKCGQTDVLPFGKAYPKKVLSEFRKIGEGVFGEVFLNERAGPPMVLKVVPIEGTALINDAQQKKFNEMLQEVIISQQLSALRINDDNHTAGFVEVLNVRLVKGRYPSELLAHWSAFDFAIGSDNECPDFFDRNQLFVVFELCAAGIDLEKFEFKTPRQAFSVFKQVAISLAIAESKLEFEHRDLHWGNVLIAPTKEKSLWFRLNGENIEVATHGVNATIIDYTLSRIVYDNHCYYQDLAADPELFEAVGDYQFDIYRQMKRHTENQWERFTPITNLLWMHYLLDKMIHNKEYQSNGRDDRKVLKEMKALSKRWLKYDGVSQYVQTGLGSK